jgi:transposase InsO family protein
MSIILHPATAPPTREWGQPAPHRLQVRMERTVHGRHRLGKRMPALPVGQGTPPCPGTPAAHTRAHSTVQLHPRGPGEPPPSSKGFTHLFTIMDKMSCWLEAIPIATTTTVDCANALFQGWVSRFGVPSVITSDRGTQFTSSLWAALCCLLNIQHAQTTAYYQQSNRMVERFHRHLKDAFWARYSTAN